MADDGEIHMNGKEDPLVLHKCAWRNEIKSLKEILETEEGKGLMDQLDHHGNSPLHIAAHFGHSEIAELLLDAGANPEKLSTPGWRPIDEAVASGHMPLASLLMRSGFRRYRTNMEGNTEERHKRLAELPDFYMEIHWDFKLLGGWVPSGLVHHYIPNDVYRMWKRGDAVRVDYTLVGFKNFSITRGHVSMLYTGSEQEPKGHLVALNHDDKTVQDFCAAPGENYDTQINDALKYTFAHDLCSYLPLNSSEEETQFVPATTWYSNAQKTETVHGNHASIYHTKGLCLRSLYRSDPHAKQTRIPRSPQSEKLHETHRKRFNQYFGKSKLKKKNPGYEKGILWETEVPREQIKKFEGNVWLSNEFPLSVEDLTYLVELYSPTSQQWRRLEEYLKMHLPDGYPVRIQIPVWYGVTANVDCRNFQHETAPKEMFEIPRHYTVIQEAYVGQETREMFKTAKKDEQ